MSHMDAEFLGRALRTEVDPLGYKSITWVTWVSATGERTLCNEESLAGLHASIHEQGWSPPHDVVPRQYADLLRLACTGTQRIEFSISNICRLRPEPRIEPGQLRGNILVDQWVKV